MSNITEELKCSQSKYFNLIFAVVALTQRAFTSGLRVSGPNKHRTLKSKLDYSFKLINVTTLTRKDTSSVFDDGERVFIAMRFSSDETRIQTVTNKNHESLFYRCTKRRLVPTFS